MSAIKTPITVVSKGPDDYGLLDANGMLFAALMNKRQAEKIVSVLNTPAPTQAGWRSIDTALKDGTLILVWAPGREGLPPLYSLCAWHKDAGFCIDELRSPTHWQPLPVPPKEPQS